MGCTSFEDCSEHGDCRVGVCSCDIGWYSATCSQSGKDLWSPFWQIFRVMYSILFLLLFVYAIKKLMQGMMLRRSLGCRRNMLRLVKSPKNLSLLFIVLASLLRTILAQH